MTEVNGGNASSLSEKENMDHKAKKVKINGMRSVIGLKKIEAISTQIAVMERLEAGECLCCEDGWGGIRA